MEERMKKLVELIAESKKLSDELYAKQKEQEELRGKIRDLYARFEWAEDAVKSFVKEIYDEV